MSKIISIGTAVPSFRHRQDDILHFMERVYAPGIPEKRKLKFLYNQGGIDTRYSVIPDYSLPASDWKFYSPTENLEPFPGLEKRMQWFKSAATPLSLSAIRNCIKDDDIPTITHLITVSCTGMSAPGLDLEIVQALGLPGNVSRTAVNFMGCYAAIHALKIADAFCKTNADARVLIVCTELCTLHFQKEYSVDNITSSMLFADGSAAILVTNEEKAPGPVIGPFHSALAINGKDDMAWELSSTGFRMTLSSHVADLVENNFENITGKALNTASVSKDDISHWCIHPGGKKILEAVQHSLNLDNNQLEPCYTVLKNYGNMSSPTVVFVLQEILKNTTSHGDKKIFMAAFGPGLSMETLILNA